MHPNEDTHGDPFNPSTLEQLRALEVLELQQNADSAEFHSAPTDNDVSSPKEHDEPQALRFVFSKNSFGFGPQGQTASELDDIIASARSPQDNATERAQLPPKRGPGRPKKQQPGSQPDERPDDKPKRPVGRPPGTGPRQLAAAQGTMKPKKRPVGRPRNYPVFGSRNTSSKLSIVGLRVPGLPATGPSHRSTSIASSHTQSTSTPTLAEDQPQPPSPPLPAVHQPSSPTASCAGFDPEPSTAVEETETTLGGLTTDDNPSRMLDVEDNDEDSEAELLEDGTGDDDDAGDEGDEEGLDGPRVQGKKVPLRPLPTWLQTKFDVHVKASAVRGPDGLPPLYRDHHTFWFPEPAVYFTLQKSDISPQDIYEHRFFLWDPLALLSNGLCCPNKGCSARLRRHSPIPRPRRVVDLNGSFWVIGYRYRCPKCCPPDPVTFRSWDSRILASLPPELAAEFPARLTYRSGLSTSALTLMRSCFHHGLGAKQFANTLLVQHLENYDRLHLRYLQTIASRSLCATIPFTKKFKSFPPFGDKSPEGFHGFVPSSQWLRDLYDNFIGEHQQELNQHMSMLTGKICAIDHSFKLAKHIAKVDGIQVFTALLTVTNEKGEIRVCNLVATKSHSQFELALQRMRHSLDLYGHDQPSIFYTDNMADKEFLEKCFPSLRNDLVPIETQYSHLEPLEIPEHFQISVKKSATTIDDAMRTILELLPENDDSPSMITIGLDAEWNIEISERGYVSGRGQTAVLQIAHDTKIYILQIGHMLAGNNLPLLLRQVLANPKIRKVGRCVTGDLKYLQEACQSDVPFVGGFDLAKLAKDKLVVKTARASLAELCASVLSRRLNKDVPQRMSTSWEDDDLTEEQVQYAALDVHASLAIYNALLDIPSPQPLPKNPKSGTPVILFNSDRSRILAHGIISPHMSAKSFDGVDITSSRAVIDVQEVLVPGALIANGSRHPSNKKPLESYGLTPFPLVCLRNHLRQSSVLPISLPGPSQASATGNVFCNSDVGPSSLNPVDPMPLDNAYETGSSNGEGTSFERNGPGFGDLLSGLLSSDTVPNQMAVHTRNTHTPDSASQAEGKKALDGILVSDWVKHVRSRVLKDPFHVFNQFYISAAHGLLREFAVALRDAMFIPDQTDKARIIAWGRVQQPPQSWDEILFKRPAWLQRRCKRIIPPPEQLLPLVANVFKTYGPLKDAKSGLPLFNSAAWAVAKNTLLLIQRGHLSDPPGDALYRQVGIDIKTGLPLYRCIRGTNSTEGGVHTKLRPRLPTSGASICHVQHRLSDFIYRHNILASLYANLKCPLLTSFQVGTFNSTGRRYVGHYSLWLTNQLQEMLSLVQDILIDPQLPTGWVNGNLYLPSNEVAGILPIPDQLRARLGMGSYAASLHSKQKHHFLASMQGTRKPVLPIHNAEERELFRDFMMGNTGFNNPSAGPNWDLAVELWNNTAEVKDNVSYKLSEQLKVYYNGDWKKNANIKQTKAMTAGARVPVLKTLRDPRRSIQAPRVLESQQTLHSAPKGLRPITSADSLQLISSAIGPASNSHLAPVFPPVNHASTSSSSVSVTMSSAQPLPAPTDQIAAHIIAQKRARETLHEPPAARKRQRRTCRKCADPDCKGKKSVDKCMNRCQDCGEVVCRGRNTKRPDRSCKTGWD